MRALTVDPREAGSLRAVEVCGTDMEIGERPLVKVPGAGLRCIRRWAVVIVTLARSMLSSNGDSASAPEDFAA